jgi:hypothetical protein
MFLVILVDGEGKGKSHGSIIDAVRLIVTSEIFVASLQVVSRESY